MRRSNVQDMNEIVNLLLKELNIDQKLKEVRLINSWNEVLGNTVARSTDKIFIKNRVLFVYLRSSVVRSELMMLKTGIIKSLNDKVGEKIIDEIVLR
jgi:hypothetical protein